MKETRVRASVRPRAVTRTSSRPAPGATAPATLTALWDAEPFDPADPVNTPRGLNTDNPAVRLAAGLEIPLDGAHLVLPGEPVKWRAVVGDVARGGSSPITYQQRSGAMADIAAAKSSFATAAADSGDPSWLFPSRLAGHAFGLFDFLFDLLGPWCDLIVAGGGYPVRVTWPT